MFLPQYTNLNPISPGDPSACRTIGDSEPCIFPFVYKNRTFTACTKFESANNAAWCATAVDANNQIMGVDWASHNNWGDCEPISCGLQLPPGC